MEEVTAERMTEDDFVQLVHKVIVESTPSDWEVLKIANGAEISYEFCRATYKNSCLRIYQMLYAAFPCTFEINTGYWDESRQAFHPILQWYVLDSQPELAEVHKKLEEIFGCFLPKVVEEKKYHEKETLLFEQDCAQLAKLLTKTKS